VPEAWKAEGSIGRHPKTGDARYSSSRERLVSSHSTNSASSLLLPRAESRCSASVLLPTASIFLIFSLFFSSCTLHLFFLCKRASRLFLVSLHRSITQSREGRLRVRPSLEDGG
jgi:hypothetical protein